jgi:DNA polymerase-1
MYLAQDKCSKFRITNPTLIGLKTKEEVDSFLDKWESYDGITAFDTETKGLDPWSPTGKIICLTLSFDSEKNIAYYLPFNLIDIQKLEKFFRQKKLVGNNTKYDFRWLRVKAKLPKECLHLHWDNMQGSHAINELQYNSLKSDAWLYTPYGGYDLPLVLYLEKYPACKEDYSLIPYDVLFPYATMDALVSLECYRKQQIEIDELDEKCKIDNGWSIRRALIDVVFPAVEMFTDIEINGMCYDWDKLKVLSNELQEDLSRRRKELYTLLKIPETVKIDSGDQLGKFLESIGWENPGRSKKGIYLTNEASMTYWKNKGHTEVDVLNEYTEASTIMKTFVGVEVNEKGKPTGYWQYRKSDNKLHGNFSVCMADSWRGKSYDPNLQNIVKNSTVKLNGVPLHERVRACFSVPDDNYYFSEHDGAGLQLRIVASESKDKNMEDAFVNQGGDLHSKSAASIFTPEITLEYFIEHKKEKPFKDYRKKAKGVNFSLVFNTTAFAFAKSSLLNEWALEEARDYVTKNKLEERQQKLYQTLVKDISTQKGILDKACFMKDQLEFSFYWASAEDIKSKFFKTYPEVKTWIEEGIKFSKKNGYVQSLWGCIRRTPLLTYIGKNDDDSRTKNWMNIVPNSPTQNFEVLWILYNMTQVHNAMSQANMKTFIVGNIHDSFVAYLHKEELNKFKEITLNYFSKPMPELMGAIPYEIELGFSDYQKGEYWGVTEHGF